MHYTAQANVRYLNLEFFSGLLGLAEDGATTLDPRLLGSSAPWPLGPLAP